MKGILAGDALRLLAERGGSACRRDCKMDLTIPSISHSVSYNVSPWRAGMGLPSDLTAIKQIL
jgi:hypothetical protein